MGKVVQRHKQRRLLDAVFETSCNLANHIIGVLKVATVDVPGVIISRLRRPCKHEFDLFGRNKIVYRGLPKVAQTESGTAKLA